MLSGDGSNETKKQLEKMISNIDRGIENTPENLGLTKPASQTPGADTSGAGTGTAPAEQAPAGQEINPSTQPTQ
jgi:hypothetical protein